MDYYQGVVTDYLRADRSMFVNTECCIQLNEAGNPDQSGPHWYCDAVAVDLRAEAVYLCEISYSKGLGALLKRLSAWSSNWPMLKQALARDCSISLEWPVRPWLFIPDGCVPRAVSGIQQIALKHGTVCMPVPKITKLEAIAPVALPVVESFREG